MAMAFWNLCFHFGGNEPGTDDIDEWQVIDQVQSEVNVELDGIRLGFLP